MDDSLAAPVPLPQSEPAPSRQGGGTFRWDDAAAEAQAEPLPVEEAAIVDDVPVDLEPAVDTSTAAPATPAEVLPRGEDEFQELDLEDLGPGAQPVAHDFALPDLDLMDDLGFATPATIPATAGPAFDDAASIEHLTQRPAPSAPSLAPAAGSEPTVESDDLEFDPMGASMSPSAPSAPSDGGPEILDFIDTSDATAAGPRIKRYGIRRRNGKTLGPFEEAAVVKLLQEGKLLGNEDVSSDGDSWVGIASLPAFSKAIQEIMVSSSRSVDLPETAEEKALAIAAFARLQDIYGGRMANSAIVESVDHFATLRRRLPALIGGVVALVALAVGLGLGFTEYGYFGVYEFLGPPHTVAGSPAALRLQEARSGLQADTYASYAGAAKLAEEVERLDPRAVDAQAVEAQALFYLQRRFGVADSRVVSARQRILRIGSVGKRDPDIIRANAGLELVMGNPRASRPALERLLLKLPRDEETLYLLAEGHFLDDRSSARHYLEAIIGIDPKSAKALHALGYLATFDGDIPVALAEFRRAFASDPRHLSSRLEADHLQAVIDGSFDTVETDLRGLSENEGTLSPGERSELWYLLGDAAGHRRAAEAEADFKRALALDPANTAAMAEYGRFLLAQHRLDEALPLLSRAVAAHPKDANLADALVRVQVGLGLYPDASKTLGRALPLAPSDPRLVTLAGRISEALGKVDDAEQLYLKALKLEVGYEEAHLALGHLLLARRDLVKAKVEFEAAAAKSPKSSLAHAGYGVYLVDTGDVEGARRELELALRLDDQDPEAHFGRGLVLARSGDVSGAEAELDLAEKLDPLQPGLRLELGTLLWTAGNLPEAEKELSLAVSAAPKDPLPPLRLGAVLLAEGRVDPAIQSLRASIALSSRLPDAHRYLARALLLRSDNNRALQEAKTADDLAPKDADNRYVTGLAEESIGSFPEAKVCFEEALKLRPGFPDAEQELGNVETQLGDDDAAIAAYGRAMGLDAKRAALALSVGDLQAKAKKFKEAISSYQLAIAQDPSLVQAYYLIGRAFDELGKAKEAAKFYEEAIGAQPQNPLPFKYLGYFYKGRGDSKRALDAFRNYLKLRPDADDKEVVSEEIGYLEQG